MTVAYTCHGCGCVVFDEDSVTVLDRPFHVECAPNEDDDAPAATHHACRDCSEDGASGRVYPPVASPQPNDEDLSSMAWGSAEAEATDGCDVEPDGWCIHGHPSWLIRLGLI